MAFITLRSEQAERGDRCRSAVCVNLATTRNFIAYECHSCQDFHTKGRNERFVPPTPHVLPEHTFFTERWAMYDWAEFRHFRYLLAILEEQGVRAAAEMP
jgi:hypothetical protein